MQRPGGQSTLPMWVHERDYHQVEAWSNFLDISELQGAWEAQWGSQRGYFPGQGPKQTQAGPRKRLLSYIVD